jgi:hypothetical protein
VSEWRGRGGSGEQGDGWRDHILIPVEQGADCAECRCRSTSVRGAGRTGE